MKTLIIIRPHALRRGLVGDLLTRFERHGIRIAGLKAMRLEKKKAEKLYQQHKGTDYYERLITNMLSGPLIAAVLDIDVPDPESAVSMVRKIIGNTDPAKAEMGTIRGDYGLRIDQNIIHASDDTTSAKKEIPLFFKEEELVIYRD